MNTLKLEDLSVEQKIGQLIIARKIDNPEDFDFAMGLIRDHALGGVQVGMKAGLREQCIDPVLETADYPIFVAETMECGYQLGETVNAGNLAMAALGDEQLVYEYARIFATEIKKIGYNMTWTPDVDLTVAGGPLRTLRCFGGDKEVVARYAIPYMRALSECGVIASAKHYPSVFDITVDTHMQKADSYHTREELLEKNLYPYREAIRLLGPEMPSVMTTHTKLVNIDPDYPVTVSKKCMDILREIGFDGLAITDSLAMMGIVQRFGDENLPGMAIAAGHDMVLPNYRLPLKDAYNHLLNAYRSGAFDEARLNEACRRVLRTQAMTLRQPAQPELTQEDRQILHRINTGSICAVTDSGLPASIDTQKRHLFVILKQNAYDEDDAKIDPEVGFPKVWNPERLGQQFLEKFPNSDVMYICEFPHRLQNERVCAAAVSHDDVVFVTFCERGAYQGTDGLTERMRVLIGSMADRVEAIVHVGNPQALEKVVHMKRILFGFPHAECLEALPGVLAGEIPARGRMPIELKLQ